MEKLAEIADRLEIFWDNLSPAGHYAAFWALGLACGAVAC